jgi:flagellar biosynthesis/type III secretory pathway chaperone
MIKDKLNLQLHQIIGLWKELCHLHNQLYEMTCFEYTLLLESRIDELDELIKEKQKIIEQVDRVDSQRSKILKDIADESNHSVQIKFNSLIEYFQKFDLDCSLLLKYNDLFIDIIEKIQAQNIVNQKFINKAMLSLKELKNELTQNTPITYSSTGHHKARF